MTRSLLVIALLIASACGRSRERAAADSAPTPRADDAAAVDGSLDASDGGTADADVSLPPPAATPSPTLAMAGGECQLGESQEIAALEAELSAVTLLLDQAGGLAAWVAQRGEVTLQPLLADGSSNGAAQTLEIDGAREVFALRRRDDGFRLFALAGTDLHAVDLDATGRVVGEPRDGRIVACRPALEGLVPVIAPPAMRIDRRRHLAYQVHWHNDELHLVCLDYRQMELRRVEVTDDGVEVSDREICRTGNVKGANVLGYWWLSDGERWVMLSRLFDEDWYDDSERRRPYRYLLRTPEWTPNPGMESIGGLTRLPAGIAGEINAARLIDETVEMIIEDRRGAHHYWRVGFDGEALTEPREVDASSIPETFADFIHIELAVEDGTLQLIRRDALGENIDEEPLAIGPISLRRARGVRIDPPADWQWTGRDIALLWAEHVGGTTTIRSRVARCPGSMNAD